MPARVTSSGDLRVFISTDAVGGVWNYSLALAAGLRARGVACCLAVVGPPASLQQRQDVAALPGCALDDTGLALDWTARDLTELEHTARDLLRRARAFGATSLHLHAPALVARSDIPTVAVAHSCVATWWSALHATALPDDLAWRARATAEGLAAATHTIAPTQAFGRALQKSYPGSLNATIIHNGLPPRPPLAAPRGEMILTAGRLWDTAKNARVLDEAAALMRPAIHAAGPCDGPNGQRFSAANLQMLGNLSSPALHETMSRAAIFASPSRYEPFGLAVLEAAQTGAPLVLADIPTFRELWSGAALFVPPTDARAWADTLSNLSADEAQRVSLGQAARDRAARYTLAAMIDRIVPMHASLATTSFRAA